MLSVILWSLPLLYGGGCEEIPGSYLYRALPCTSGTEFEFEPYVAQEGDLVFFDRPSRLWDTLDAMAGTGPPDHMGIMVKLPEGQVAILEAGPDKYLHVYIQDWLPRLQQFYGTIWVRRLRCPLAPEQSAALTDFALRQEGKRYAIFRLVRQVTPFRARGPLRTKCFGKTWPDRWHWFCSELVLTAGAIAGLFDPKQMPANAIYPRDILDDCKFELGGLYEEAGRWTATDLSFRVRSEEAGAKR